MKMIMARLQNFGRFRQLHTIISQETIKPSSQTPLHLKTHNLSVLDHFAPNLHMPWVFFYRNYKKGDINNLKKSLSQCLTQYYPLVGRLPTPNARYVDCNDEGVEFLEASHDSPLDDFIHKKERDETIYKLFPNGLGCVGKSSPNLVEVQLNHFKGGGAAVAVSISHRVADGLTMINFIDHWATVARGGSPINPNFFSSSTSSNISEFPISSLNEVKYVTRIFVFPNSKLNELKKKVSAMGVPPMNPSRVEVLTSLIFKCAVYATTTNTMGFVKPAYLLHTVNTRNIIIKNNPEKAAGNFATYVMSKTEDPSVMRLHEVVAGLRKVKKELGGLGNMQEVGENLVNTLSMLQGDLTQRYVTSSICGFPLYEADFGWGKPVEVILAGPDSQNKILVLNDTPNKDGIVATVHLPEDEMLIFQDNKELLSYVN